jgi:hypothetical protein
MQFFLLFFLFFFLVRFVAAAQAWIHSFPTNQANCVQKFFLFLLAIVLSPLLILVACASLCCRGSTCQHCLFYVLARVAWFASVLFCVFFCRSLLLILLPLVQVLRVVTVRDRFLLL